MQSVTSLPCHPVWPWGSILKAHFAITTIFFDMCRFFVRFQLQDKRCAVLLADSSRNYMSSLDHCTMNYGKELL